MESETSREPNSPKKETKPLTFEVKSTVAHLALRYEPRVAAETLFRFLEPDEILHVIDPDNPLAKVGVKGQWLLVRTEGGSEGYVAAWFVERI